MSLNLSALHQQNITVAEEIWLLLDYDGTLADFAPTPDDVIPDPELIALLQELARHPKIRMAIISGRRLAHIKKLVPISGIWLAGSYGLEMRTPNAQPLQRADFEQLRPQLEELKPQWADLIQSQEGFYLEDKGWSLALHARFAEDLLAEQILEKTRSLAKQTCSDDSFKLLGGHKFLEIAPREADKGNTVTYLLQRSKTNLIFPIYLGDDDKDERAFPVVQAHGGIAGCVCHRPRATQADFQLQSPHATRQWLAEFYEFISQNT
jgi:trehalose 6-phosphate phosphatase